LKHLYYFPKRSSEVPQDRDNSFEPQLIAKRKRVLEEIEDHVLTLYSHGMSTQDIESTIKDLYDVEMRKPISPISLIVLSNI